MTAAEEIAADNAARIASLSQYQLVSLLYATKGFSAMEEARARLISQGVISDRRRQVLRKLNATNMCEACYIAGQVGVQWPSA